MTCCCTIIPADILDKLSNDSNLDENARANFAKTAALDAQLRKVRTETVRLTSAVAAFAGPSMLAPPLAAAPQFKLFDCQGTMSLPGSQLTPAQIAADATAKRAMEETKAVADFYKKVFGRNSIDGAGMTMLSSIHYGTGYNNAFWNGQQMTYGDGDGKIFLDFTGSNDVICHELTHGVTQFSAQLAYSNEAGGLNESMSDVFGSMFRQWRAGQDVKKADWLIGADIMGPEAKKRKFTCLRDMADPTAKHCLAPQVKRYQDYSAGLDPHFSSGIPNYAFYVAAMAVGGNSWDTVGKIWYQVLTGYAANPNLSMATFAARTRKEAAKMFAKTPAVAAAVDKGWKAVGL